MVELTIKKRESALFRYTLDSGTATIGRSPDNEIQLNSPSVSHQHARISLSEGVCTIQDLASKGGTLVNDVATEQAQLQDQDVIQVGHYRIVCSIKSAHKPKNVRSLHSLETRRIQNSNKADEPRSAKDHVDRHIALSNDSNDPSAARENIDKSRPAPAALSAQLAHDRRDSPNGENAGDYPATAHSTQHFTSQANVPPLHGTGIDVLTGPAQGKRIYFTRDSAALGMKEVTAVVIKSVEHGYIAQASDQTIAVTLNGEAVGNSPVQLDDGDLIAFSNLSARFFIEPDID